MPEVESGWLDGVEKTEPLAHYVFEVAFHVIFVWFIALKQADRRQYVPYITKGLLGAQNSSQATELAHVCLDILARYTFANCQTKPTRYPSLRAFVGLIFY